MTTTGAEGEQRSETGQETEEEEDSPKEEETGAEVVSHSTKRTQQEVEAMGEITGTEARRTLKEEELQRDRRRQHQ